MQLDSLKTDYYAIFDEFMAGEIGALENYQQATGAKVEFTVPQNTHNTIRYYCTVHGTGMGNTINVTGTVIQLSPVAAVSGLSMTVPLTQLHRT